MDTALVRRRNRIAKNQTTWKDRDVAKFNPALRSNITALACRIRLDLAKSYMIRHDLFAIWVLDFVQE